MILVPVAGICQKANKKNKKADAVNAAVDYRALGAPLPPVRALTTSGKWITSESLKNDANLLIMLFNPTCEHCEDMTVLMEKNIHLFKKGNALLLAAQGMMPYIDYFKNNTKVDQYPTLQVGVDSSQVITKLFNYTTLPQINIYDHDRKLIKTFNGDTPLDSLKMYIE